MRRWRRRMTTPGVTVGVGYHDKAGTLYFEQCSQVSLLIIINVHILSSLFVVVVVISAVAVVVVERLVTVLVGW